MTSQPYEDPQRLKTLPPEVRVVVLLFVIDLCLALWFTLNWPPGMAFVVSQVPTLGVASMMWGLLPRERTSSLSDWIATVLQHRLMSAALVLLFGGLTLLSCLVNTVVVRGDPLSPEWVYRYDGLDELAHGAAAIPADSLRLRRGSGPLYFRVWMWPWGRPVWFQSTTRLINQAQHIVPWKPTQLSLDDDFGMPVTIAVLPGLEAMRLDSVQVLVTGRTLADTLATGMLPTGGGALLLSFGGGIVSAKAAEAWRSTADSLRSDGLDSAFTDQLAVTWRNGMRGARTWRRLQLNDTVHVRVSAAHREAAVHEVPIADSLTRFLVLR
ncbi:MAG: hypothetical protein H7099_06115 [Gemmatimonadaceae bacterium]|nr:hypothetical protein [Gemmatimonadaceae bacterium]